MNTGQKIKVAILFGGKSAEHEVSLQSAKSVINAIDKSKYELLLIGIDKSGKWYLNDQSHYLLNENNPKLIKLNNSNVEVTIVPTETSNQLLNIQSGEAIDSVEVVFPVLHGSYGEDGTIQGLLKLLNIPFVGCSVLGSAMGMDKDVAKRLWRDAGIPVAKWKCVTKKDLGSLRFEEVKKELGLPMFVKPANAGSSVGVSKVTSAEEFITALEEAFLFDRKVLIEENIKGREIEVAVLGNEDVSASVPGEVIPQDSFYSYKAKYIDEKGALLSAPAQLTEAEIKTVQQQAIRAFKAVCCEGLSRVDFFLKENGEFVLNEINTLPGFTSISMYPKLWQLSGIEYPELIDRLISLAIERHRAETKLQTNYV
jgi:D-alanine-D-alanine ligase